VTSYDRELIFCLQQAGYEVGRRTRNNEAISIESDGRIAWLYANHDLDITRADIGTPFSFVLILVVRHVGLTRKQQRSRKEYPKTTLIKRLAMRRNPDVIGSGFSSIRRCTQLG